MLLDEHRPRPARDRRPGQPADRDRDRGGDRLGDRRRDRAEARRWRPRAASTGSPGRWPAWPRACSSSGWSAVCSRRARSRRWPPRPSGRCSSGRSPMSSRRRPPTSTSSRGWLDATGLPEVFIGLEPFPAAPVDRPTDAEAERIAAAAEKQHPGRPGDRLRPGLDRDRLRRRKRRLRRHQRPRRGRLEGRRGRLRRRPTGRRGRRPVRPEARRRRAPGARGQGAATRLRDERTRPGEPSPPPSATPEGRRSGSSRQPSPTATRPRAATCTGPDG